MNPLEVERWLKICSPKPTSKHKKWKLVRRKDRRRVIQYIFRLPMLSKIWSITHLVQLVGFCPLLPPSPRLFIWLDLMRLTKIMRYKLSMILQTTCSKSKDGHYNILTLNWNNKTKRRNYHPNDWNNEKRILELFTHRVHI